MKKMSLILIFAGCACLWLTGTALSATLCVNPSDAGCFATIQSAVDAAAPGDKILISPNPSPKGYTENVVVNTAGLTIGGTSFDYSKVIVDTCETIAYPAECGGSGFEINAADVSIKNLTIRHSSYGIQIMVGGDNATVKNVCFVENARNGVYADNDLGTVDDVEVTRCMFSGSHSTGAIDIRGDNALVRYNTLLNAEGIEIYGDGAVIMANHATVSTDDEFVQLTGNNGLITLNTFEACESGCVENNGDNTTISFNRFKGAPDADSAIETYGNSQTIKYNKISLTTDSGINHSGNTSRIYGNLVERAGADEDSEGGIEIRGDDNEVSGNILNRNSLAGILNESGNNNVYKYNMSSENGRSGIRIKSGDGNVADGNLTTGNHGEGINNGGLAANIDVVNNTSLGNATDVSNDGTISTFTSNSYITGGTTTPCVIEQ